MIAVHVQNPPAADVCQSPACYGARCEGGILRQGRGPVVFAWCDPNAKESWRVKVTITASLTDAFALTRYAEPYPEPSEVVGYRNGHIVLSWVLRAGNALTFWVRPHR